MVYAFILTAVTYSDWLDLLVFVISRRRVVFVTVGDATVVRRFSHTSVSPVVGIVDGFFGKQFWLYW